MNDEITLLPCPFCGNAKNLAMVNEKHDHSGGYFIACPECGASTIMRYAMGDDPKPLLIEAWNRRAALAAQPGAVVLTDEQIKRHSLLAADCPGASTVILVSSLRRLLAAAPTEAKPAQQDAVDAEAGALSPEQEEWVMDLAQKHNLGRRVGQIGTLQGVSPDVFYTDASYRTQELFDFAAELLASSELNADQRRALVGNWFAEDWAVHQALGLLDDYDTERAAISAKKGGA